MAFFSSGDSLYKDSEGRQAWLDHAFRGRQEVLNFNAISSIPRLLGAKTPVKLNIFTNSSGASLQLEPNSQKQMKLKHLSSASFLTNMPPFPSQKRFKNNHPKPSQNHRPLPRLLSPHVTTEPSCKTTAKAPAVTWSSVAVLALSKSLLKCTSRRLERQRSGGFLALRKPGTT